MTCAFRVVSGCFIRWAVSTPLHFPVVRQVIDEVHDADLRATVEAQLACALVELDAVEEAETHTRQALANATAGGDPNAELDAIRARIMLMWRPADDDEVFLPQASPSLKREDGRRSRRRKRATRRWPRPS